LLDSSQATLSIVEIASLMAETGVNGKASFRINDV